MMKSLLKTFLLLTAFALTQISCVPAPEDDDGGNQNQPIAGNGDTGTSGGMGDDDQEQGDDESGDNAVAIAEGSFRIYADDLLPAVGSGILGISSNFAWPKALEMYGQAGGRGGLFRLFVNMFSDNDIEGRSLRDARDSGLLTMITVTGTPFELATAFEGEELGPFFPVYARSMPSDLDAYCDLIIARIERLDEDYGIIPDYVEIWDEPDIPHYWSSSLENFLLLYKAVSLRIRQEFPSIKIGGMGAANWRSKMGGDQPALITIAEQAAAENLPLDFISWHNYAPTSELVRSKWCDTARGLLANLGFPEAELMMTEWNLHSAVQGPTIQHDRSNSAASFAGFMTTAIESGIDNAVFFKLLDDPVEDLVGEGVGSISHHGIKKPAFRLMEEFMPMMQEVRARTERYESEYSLQLFSSRSGNRLRMVLSNSVEDAEWAYASACRENGYSASTMWMLYKLAVSESSTLYPSEMNLMSAGMTAEEASFSFALESELRTIKSWKSNNREVELNLNTNSDFQIARVVRFDSSHNAPTQYVDALQDRIAHSEKVARQLAREATVKELNDMGYPVTLDQVTQYEGNLAAMGTKMGMSHQELNYISRFQGRATFEYRLESEAMLNSLPETALQIESAEQAAVTLEGNIIRLEIEPEAVTVIDIQLY
ncbi:MAG: hypothetical protein HOM34_01675 [Planctomycetes bacterium]|jgi:hypothetical protein|nr:hypothetical protein [Planctomycetota bacterium]MBT4029097.1 hypothetical protein [Planctomycetota bacterium]MBT4560475.1 hypothetical protein [Planctomycetota bacterium]MBT5102166.1 hypothetical protein [Planctomycetota bacterium]MBT5119411.1 hypothetical protein [Planctomycetota bacterium]